MRLNRPVRFTGTRQEARDNYNSHQWEASEEGVTCFRCDSRSTSIHAEYPCGTEAPRETVEIVDGVATNVRSVS